VEGSSSQEQLKNFLTPVAQQFPGNTDDGEERTAAELVRSPAGFPPPLPPSPSTWAA